MPNLNGRNNSRLALFSIGWVGSEVGDVNYCFGSQHATEVGFRIGMDRCAHNKFSEGRPCPLYSYVAQGVAVPAADSSSHCIADADGVLQHGLEHWLKIAGELEMTLSTSDVAVCCSSASSRSRVRRSSCSCRSAIDGVRLRAAFGALPRFGASVLRRCVGLPPALERRFTGFTQGSDMAS